MTLPPGHRLPWRTLAGLTAAVLAAHLLVLQSPPGLLSVRAPAPLGALATRPLITRAIAPTAPVTVGAVTPPGPSPALAQAGEAARRPVPATAPHLTPAPARVSEPKVPEVQAPRPLDAPETIAKQTPPLTGAAAAPAPPAGEPPTLPAAFAIPGSARLRYEVRGEARHQPYRADAVLQWRHDGSDYQARLEISAFLVGSRQQTSMGQVTADGLAPTRFADKSRSEQAAHFERDKARISFSSNAPAVPLRAGAQDRLSVLIQLGAMVAANPAHFRPGTTVSIQTASTRDADVWQFSFVGPETLALPGGERQTLKFIRHPRHEFDQKLELWISPEMDYLPARLKLTQANGDWADQQWLATDRG